MLKFLWYLGSSPLFHAGKKVFVLKKGRKKTFVKGKSTSAQSCLPLERPTHGACYLKADTVLSGAALRSEQGASPEL